MSTTLPLIPGRLLDRLRSPWFGIDIGTHAIKVAQVARARHGWQIINKSSVVLREAKVFNGGEYVDGALTDVVRRAFPTASRFRCRNAACLLPMSAMELRSFEVPAGTDEELRGIVEQEVSANAEDGSSEMEFDLWRNGNSAGRQDNMVNVSALMVSRRIATAVGTDLFKAGIRCEVLDGLPFALARAVQMADPRNVKRATAAIDWGFSSAIFILVMDGRPVYSRPFLDCGVRRLVDAVCKGLGLPFLEGEQLLTTYGPLPTSTNSSSNDIRTTMAQIASGPLRQFAEEIKKTLSYLKQQPELLPQRIWLFGGGATFDGVAESLSESVGLETVVWQLPTEPSGGHDAFDRTQALYGPAIALSALAGER